MKHSTKIYQIRFDYTDDLFGQISAIVKDKIHSTELISKPFAKDGPEFRLDIMSPLTDEEVVFLKLIPGVELKHEMTFNP